MTTLAKSGRATFLNRWFAGLAILLVLLTIDHWIFITWFNTTHLKWYLATGASISLVTSIASLAWGEMGERHIGLISAHPFAYMGSYFQFVGLPMWASTVQLEIDKGEKISIDRTLNRIAGFFLLLILTGAMLIWLVIIVPPQYFVYVICGAPARAVSQSKSRPIALFIATSRLKIDTIRNDKTIPDGWWDASINRKPMAMTNLFALLFFLIAKLLMG
jgi:hypothetical protein